MLGVRQSDDGRRVALSLGDTTVFLDAEQAFGFALTIQHIIPLLKP